VEFTYNPGCVVQTVSDNWVDGDSELKQRNFVVDKKGKRYHGTWLLIDEFNRANIDKSFGEMFTAIEHGKLTISDNKNNNLTRKLKIPANYRIIGTLNSTDKHFLTELSNALKRRFAMIEISYPKYEEKYRELYHVVKKSIKGLELPEIEKTLNHEKQEYIPLNDIEIDKIIENLYNIIFFVRQMKPLGTSIFARLCI
jgi:MoxR-like ATPase